MCFSAITQYFNLYGESVDIASAIQVSQKDDCSITLSKLVDEPEIVQLNCNSKAFHRYSPMALDRWVKQQKEAAACPLCKALIRNTPQEVYHRVDALKERFPKLANDLGPDTVVDKDGTHTRYMRTRQMLSPGFAKVFGSTPFKITAIFFNVIHWAVYIPLHAVAALVDVIQKVAFGVIGLGILAISTVVSVPLSFIWDEKLVEVIYSPFPICVGAIILVLPLAGWMGLFGTSKALSASASIIRPSFTPRRIWNDAMLYKNGGA